MAFVSLFQKMLWLGKSPVGFQLWKAFENIHFAVTKRDFNHISLCSFENKNYQLAHEQLFPTTMTTSSGTSFKCFFMDVTNLAQPYWSSIPCDNELLGDVVCQYDQRCILGPPKFSLPHLDICSPEQILNNTQCFTVVWTNASFCNSSCSAIADRTTMTRADSFKGFVNQFAFLLWASSIHLTPLVVQESNLSLLLKYDKFLQKYELSDMYQSLQVSAFRVFSRKSFHSNPGDMIFSCPDHVFISVQFVCDGHSDCPNGDTDEQFCNCSQKMYQYPKYFETNGACKPVFQKMLENKSAEFIASKLDTSTLVAHSKKFRCQDGSEIDFYLVDDLVADCGTAAEDEQVLINLAPEAQSKHCSVQSMIPCLSGHIICYHIFQLCSFTLNFNGHLSPCRSGGHLQSCTHFECNLRFKCPNSYCIPWHYVCDGKTDCTFFHDESDVCLKTHCGVHKCTSVQK